MQDRNTIGEITTFAVEFTGFSHLFLTRLLFANTYKCKMGLNARWYLYRYLKRVFRKEFDLVLKKIWNVISAQTDSNGTVFHHEIGGTDSVGNHIEFKNGIYQISCMDVSVL